MYIRPYVQSLIPLKLIIWYWHIRPEIMKGKPNSISDLICHFFCSVFVENLEINVKRIVQKQQIDITCRCVLAVSMLPLSAIFRLDFGAVPTVWYILFFLLLNYQERSIEFFVFLFHFVIFQVVYLNKAKCTRAHSPEFSPEYWLPQEIYLEEPLFTMKMDGSTFWIRNNTRL